MASKTRAILLAVVLLSAGLAGCADTDETDTGDRETGDRDTGDGDTGDRDTGDGDTGDRDTGDTGDRDTRMEDYEKTFEDSIDEQGYERNWTFPVNETGANLTIEANLQGEAVDDFEATLWDADQEEVCTVSDGQDMGGLGDDNENMCEEEAQSTGDYTIQVWGNSTADEANYTINVTVEYGEDGQTDDGTTTGGQDDTNGGIYDQGSMARMLGT